MTSITKMHGTMNIKLLDACYCILMFCRLRYARYQYMDMKFIPSEYEP